MKCIQRECPYYYQSDIFERCTPFNKYITNKDTACNIEDFNKLKEKYACQVGKIIEQMNDLDCVLNLVKSKQ